MDNDSEEQLLKILSNPIRATIIKKLYDDTLTFTHLMQLTDCKTGQLSFHLKKLDYLVEQDELKRYKLSEKGKEDVESLLPMLGNGEKENGNSWDNISGEEDGVQLGCAFKQFWDSLGLLIFSFMAAVKHGVLYVLGSFKAGTLKLSEKTGEFSSSAKTRFTGKSFLSDLPYYGASVLKTSRRSLNPIFCYSFLILGFFLFIPAVFSYAHPAFYSAIDSAARIGLQEELTPEEISLANDLYEKEMLPDQRNYEGNYLGNSDSRMYLASYYGRKVGFPLSTQKIKTWNEGVVFSNIRLVKDFMLSCLSLSLVLLLLGGILAYRRNAVLRRVLNSVISASILLILIAIFVLLNINVLFVSEYESQALLSNSVFILKHLIALLLLLLFSSAAWLLHLQGKKGKQDHTEDRSAGADETFPASPEEETPAAEAFDEGGKILDVDQIDVDQADVADVEKKSPASGDSASFDEAPVETEGEGLYSRYEREGAVDG